MPAGKTSSYKDRAILVVEDDESMATFVQSTLSREGFKVELAFNGREGLEKLDQQKFSAIITDIRMPEMDGIEFIRKAKRHSTAKDVPIILITGMDQSRPVVEGLRAGAVFYLTKPFSPARLRQLVFTVVK